jgi:hypothetical protein
MKHPNREEWIPFVFGEAKGETRQQLARHLDECQECARQVAGWRRSLGKLDRWQLPRPQSPAILLFQPAVKWALAATLVLGIGFLVGRMSQPQAVNAAALRTEIEAGVRSSLQAQLNEALQQMQAQTSNNLSQAEARLALASAAESQQLWRGFLDVLGKARSDDAHAVQAALQQEQEQHGADLIALRKDLETLASMTDDELRQARLKMVQLAALSSSTQ